MNFVGVTCATSCLAVYPIAHQKQNAQLLLGLGPRHYQTLNAIRLRNKNLLFNYFNAFNYPVKIFFGAKSYPYSVVMVASYREYGGSRN